MSDARQDDGTPEAAAPPPAPAAPPEAPPPAPARRSRAAAWTLALLVLALALVGTSPYWAPPLRPLLPWGSEPQGGTDALAARLDAAEAARAGIAARLARLETQTQQQGSPGAAAPPDTAALQQVAQQLTALEARVGAINVPDTAALTQSLQQMGARLDDLDAKLGQLAAAQAAGDVGDVRLLAALAGLRAALAGSGPFDGELTGALALAHGDDTVAAALQPLANAAPSGIPSAALLAERFRAETAPAILHAAAAPQPAANRDIGDRVLAELKGLVTVRRIDAGASDDATGGAVSAAEAALRTGDLAGAVKTLQGLSGPAADAAKPFVTAAQQRLNAEGAVSGLARKVAGRIAAAPTPPSQESR
ncbi:MAG TPA: mitofilin family membrane protein [Stellaceae bacterium]|nr:mitofilin family membrane protein [Stellaceae bacterium]